MYNLGNFCKSLYTPIVTHPRESGGRKDANVACAKTASPPLIYI